MSTDERKHFKTRALIWAALAVGGVVAWLGFIAGEEATRAWHALLVNFLFFTSLAGGLVVWPAIVRSANGRWQIGIERLAAAAIGFAIPSLLTLIVLWIGSRHWAPWYLRRFPQGDWLNNTFLLGRDFIALLIFWGVAARYRALVTAGRGKVTGGILIAVYAFVFSLLGMDLVMALDPEWSSSLAGGYFFITGLYIAVTGWAFLSAWRLEALAEQRQDLGRLMVAFSLMSTYMMYSHLLPIWYEALPREVRFIIPRMNYKPWVLVSQALLATVYLGPLIFLLMERVKRNRWSLGIISLLVLIGMWVERWWLVIPTFHKELRFGIIEISVLLALLGLLGLGMELALQRLPKETPQKDETSECLE